MSSDLYINNFIKVLGKAIEFETILSPPVEKGPFGEANKACLDFILNESEKLGFRTFNNEGFYGYAETKTDKKETLVIAGHLDVVPANKIGWISQSPFKLEKINNKLYGRGVVDDKGPIILILFIVKNLIDEGLTPKRNIRIVFGCNEETGCKCMKKYSECEKTPNIAFTPDADFPCIYAEKGILNLKILIKNIDNINNIYGGNASNIVLDKLTVIENKTEKIFYGKAAHASTPELGDNAFISFLKTRNDSYSKFLLSKLYDINGKGMNINYECPLTGKLTMNVGKVETVDKNLVLTLDIRTPKDVNLDQLKNKIINELNAKVLDCSKTEALFIDPNSELVQKLVKSSNKVLKRNEPAIYSGGGTYAKYVKNCVAFGPQFKNSNCNIHENNENISIDHLKIAYNIYKEAIKNLAF